MTGRQREQPSALDRLDPAPREQREPAPPRPRRTRKPKPGEHEQGVLNDLAQFPEAIRRGAIAASMLSAARDLDTGAVLGRDRDSTRREIRQSVQALREMAPGSQQGDVTDDLRERRERRLTGESG